MNKLDGEVLLEVSTRFQFPSSVIATCKPGMIGQFFSWDALLQFIFIYLGQQIEQNLSLFDWNRLWLGVPRLCGLQFFLILNPYFLRQAKGPVIFTAWALPEQIQSSASARRGLNQALTTFYKPLNKFSASLESLMHWSSWISSIILIRGYSTGSLNPCQVLPAAGSPYFKRPQNLRKGSWAQSSGSLPRVCTIAVSTSSGSFWEERAFLPSLPPICRFHNILRGRKISISVLYLFGSRIAQLRVYVFFRPGIKVGRLKIGPEAGGSSMTD